MSHLIDSVQLCSDVFLCVGDSGNDTDILMVLDEQCDLLDMPAVQQLSKDAKYAPVYRLLDIFLTGRLDGYMEFHSANAALLKNYGGFFICVCQAVGRAAYLFSPVILYRDKR